MMALQPTTATINRESPRGAGWLEVFGTDTVPILGPLTHRAIGPEGTEEEFYDIDLARLSEDQIGRLIVYIARRFRLPEGEIRADIRRRHGVPILARDVTVAIDARHFL